MKHNTPPAAHVKSSEREIVTDLIRRNPNASGHDLIRMACQYAARNGLMPYRMHAAMTEALQDRKKIMDQKRAEVKS